MLNHERLNREIIKQEILNRVQDARGGLQRLSPLQDRIQDDHKEAKIGMGL